MFKKLSHTNLVPDYERLKGKLQDGYPNLSIYEIKDYDYLNEFFSPLVKFTIIPFSCHCIEITGQVLPHIDTHPYTGVLNFVAESGDASTIFYDKVDNKESFDIGSEQSSNKVKVHFKLDVIEKSRHTSVNGDFIYMDVSKIHGVQTKHSKVRKLITWRWCHISYTNLLPHIKMLC